MSKENFINSLTKNTIMVDAIPKKTILVLLLLTIVISVLGTVAVMHYAQTYTKDTSAEKSQITVQSPEPVGKLGSSSQGSVSLTVVAPK